MTVETLPNGLIVKDGHICGYMFTSTRDDAETRPGGHEYGGTTRVGGAYEPSGYVGDLDKETVDAHNRALATLEEETVKRDLPDRVAAYWTPGENRPNFWHGPRCACGPCGTRVIGYDRSINRNVTLWTGNVLGRVDTFGRKTRTLGGAYRVWLRVKIGTATYGGYATSTRDLIYLKRLAK